MNIQALPTPERRGTIKRTRRSRIHPRYVRLGCGHTHPCTPQYKVPVGPKRGGFHPIRQVHDMPNMEGARHVGTRAVVAAGAHTCAPTQATRWPTPRGTLGLAHTRARGRSWHFPRGAGHTEARDPASRTTSPGRAHTVAWRCTRVRCAVACGTHARSRAPGA